MRTSWEFFSTIASQYPLLIYVVQVQCITKRYCDAMVENSSTRFCHQPLVCCLKWARFRLLVVVDMTCRLFCWTVGAGSRVSSSSSVCMNPF